MEIDKVYTGDCLELIKQLEENAVDVSFTSPPYNRTNYRKYTEYDEKGVNFYNLLVSITDELLRVTRRDVIVNLQWTYYNKVEINKYIGHYAAELKGVSVWVKNNPQPTPPQNNIGGYSVTNAFEFFFFFSRDNDKFKANAPNTSNVVFGNINPEHFEGHNAVMNKKIAERFILDYTKEGDVILDPFFGMGTTGLVCAENNRHYIGFELSPLYAERARERIAAEMAQMRLF